MGDIILERHSDTHVMNLDSDEQALLDDIGISKERNIEIYPPRKAPNFKPKHKVKSFGQAPPQTPRVRREPEIGAFTNPTKKRVAQRYEPEDEEEDLGGEEDDMEQEEEEYYEEEGGGGGGGAEREVPSAGYTSIDEEKADLLNKLTRLEKKGLTVNKKLNAYSGISELRTEYKRVTYTIEVDASIKFSRRMLVACVSGLEFLNKRYNPVDVYLNGWSESVVENMDDYDGVFEELYNKYKTKMEVAPEVKLIMMLGGSAMMFHLTNSMFKSAIPNMSEVLKTNPDLVKSMVSAVQNTANGGNRQQEPDRFDASGRPEMRGPGIDLSSLMGGMMMPPPPVNTSSRHLPVVTEVKEEEEGDDDNISDIISVSGDSTGGEVREVKVTAPRRKRRVVGGTKKKNEISL